MFWLGMRWAALAIGVIFLLWLPVEDVAPYSVVGISCVVLVWMGIYFLNSSKLPLNKKYFIWTGVIAGFLISPFAVLLIVLKAGLHSHGFLDFSLGQISNMLLLSPVSGIVGGGLGYMGWIGFQKYIRQEN